MSLSDLASLGSFVSGLAVLVSLMFLYFQLKQVNRQVRQTEINQRAFMNQGFTTRTIEILKFTAEKENVVAINRAFSGETDFSAEELAVLANHLRMAILNFQDIVLQHSQGLADQIMLDYQMGVLRGFLTWPVYRAQWRRIRQTLRRCRPLWSRSLSPRRRSMSRSTGLRNTKPHSPKSCFKRRQLLSRTNLDHQGERELLKRSRPFPRTTSSSIASSSRAVAPPLPDASCRPRSRDIHRWRRREQNATPRGSMGR
jgi:hypothetical protein